MTDETRAKARIMALRFRIWAYANPQGWNVTTREIADAIGETTATVRKVVVDAKWGSRIRSASSCPSERGYAFRQGRLASDIATGRVNATIDIQ